MAKIRTFVAVAVSPKVQAKIAKLIERLALTGTDYKWVDRENLHITLNFLGEVD
jgi:2'-5' RNA ligase